MDQLKKLWVVLALVSAPVFAGTQSAAEKTKATAHHVERQARKAGHRVDESLCTGTKAECEAGKAKHRVNEATDRVKDDTKELKDKVDSDAR